MPPNHTMASSTTRQPKVAFLGPLGSYSHQVALSTFPAEDYQHIPQQTIGDIFTAVQTATCTHGIVPFENSTNGSVVFTLDLFADRSSTYPDLSVYGEAYLDVHHFLLGHPSAPDTPSLPVPTSDSLTTTTAPRCKPLRDLRAIKRLYSHPQAFGQCELFLQKYLKGVTRIDCNSTSEAAEYVSRDPSGASAAIASQIASEICGLEVLGKGIEDREDNTTRFFVLRKGLDGHASLPHDRNGVANGGGKRRNKTFARFTVDHTQPGALVEALDCFKRFKLNLTSINSRPSRISPFQYIFFVEFEGSRWEDAAVGKALGCLKDITEDCRWLGSYQDQLHR